jgi:hypothetical protein
MIWGGQHAGLMPAEDRISVKRHAVIEPIANHARNEPNNSSGLPRKRQLCHDADKCARFYVQATAFDQEHGFVAINGQAIPIKYLPSLIRLHSGELKDLPAIESNQKFRPRAAQAAKAIEQHHPVVRTHVRRASLGGIHGRSINKRPALALQKAVPTLGVLPNSFFPRK